VATGARRDAGGIGARTQGADQGSQGCIRPGWGATLKRRLLAPTVLICRLPVRELLADPGDVEDDDFAGAIVYLNR
jgi:hypothetical protein